MSIVPSILIFPEMSIVSCTDNFPLIVTFPVNKQVPEISVFPDRSVWWDVKDARSVDPCTIRLVEIVWGVVREDWLFNNRCSISIGVVVIVKSESPASGLISCGTNSEGWTITKHLDKSCVDKELVDNLIFKGVDKVCWLASILGATNV